MAAWAILVLSLMMSALFVVGQVRSDPFRPDYTVFWTAGSMALEKPQVLYDAETMTETQRWLTDPSKGPRPFAYPPTSLLLFVPFAQFSLWVSYLLWNAVSIAAFTAACRTFIRGKLLWLTMVSPAVVFAILSGQTALLMAGAIMVGVTELPRRPIIAGAMMGFAAAIKPQNLILAPVAFIAGRHWAAFAAFAAGGFATFALSLAFFGPTLWLDWRFGLDEFQLTLEEMSLQFWGATPLSAAYFLGIERPGATVIQVAGVAAGAAFVWWAFRKDDAELRIVALVCGCLLSSPYAMRYELAVLAPFAVKALFSGRPWGLVGALPLMANAGFLTVPAMALAEVGGRRRARTKERRPELAAAE